MYGPLDEEAAAYVLKELLRALRYLHHERKIHRDVKAGNLLLAADASVRGPPFHCCSRIAEATKGFFFFVPSLPCCRLGAARGLRRDGAADGLHGQAVHPRGHAVLDGPGGDTPAPI